MNLDEAIATLRHGQRNASSVAGDRSRLGRPPRRAGEEDENIMSDIVAKAINGDGRFTSKAYRRCFAYNLTDTL